MSEKKTLFEALASAQGEFPVIKKNAKANAGKFGYSYVTLDAIIEAIRKPMAKYNLGFYQEIQTDPAQGVLTTVFHKSGESIKVFCPFIGSYATMQQLGSCITYARRYGLQTAVGIFAEEDDDGQAATSQLQRHQANNTQASTAQNQKPIPRQGSVSEKQIKRFWALANKAGISKDQVDGMLRNWNLDSLTQISKQQYDSVCKRFEDKIAQNESVEQEQPVITADDLPFE